jgi:ABC-type Fe3+ transport system substrate-binding protein
MRMIDKVLIGAASLVLSVASANGSWAQSAKISAELQKVVDGAKQESRLVISVTENAFNGSEGHRHAVDRINTLFGTKLELSWSPGPAYAAVAAKLLAEKEANQPAHTDVFLGTAVQVAPFQSQGLFRKVDWEGLLPDRIQPSMVEGDGTALRVYTSLPAIIYNKSEEQEVLKVTSLADLLKPEWKGKFYSNPILAGFDVLVSEQVWGEQKTRDYVAAFAKQVAGVIDCGSPDRVASGEIPVVAIDCSGADPYTQKYSPVLGARILKDFAQRRYAYLTVPLNAAHPNAATLFALYWLTEEGQQYLWANNATDLIDLTASHRRDEVEKLQQQGFKFTDVTVSWEKAQPNLAQAQRGLIKLLQDNMH